jgi:ATP-dependent DNA helicase RecG
MPRAKQSPLVQNFLSLTEWENFEVKRATVSPKKLLETTCAMVNTEGGYIVVGVEDATKATGNDRLLGISEDEDNLSEYLKLMRSEFDPPLQHYVRGIYADITNVNGKPDKIYAIIIEKADDIHSLKNGDTYVRNGSQNVKIGSQEILRRRYEKGSIKFEDENSGLFRLDEVDMALLKKYQDDTGSTSSDTWQFLKDNGLTKKTKSKTTLTNAAVLLFGKNPTVSLRRKCSIRISHYYGTTRSFTATPNFVRRPFTIEGSLNLQIEDTVKYFQQAVRESSPKLSGGSFRPSLVIPEWVFQEAIANAVIHRNYAVQNDIQVRFFDDHIEIESPGTYPAQISPINLRYERFARNPVLQRVLSRFQEAPNLDIGEGVNRMFELMIKSNLYEPVYLPVSILPNAVQVTLINTRKIDYWDIVSKYLDSNGKITNQEARKVTGIEDTLQTTRLFNEWVSNKLLEKRGGKTRGAFYTKIGQDIASLLIDEAEV